MKTLVLTLLSACSTFAWAEIAGLPGSDPEGGWAVAYEQADWVSLVRVESKGTLINRSMSQIPGVVAVQGYSYNSSLLRTWKGAAGSKVVKFRVDLTDCQQELQVNGEYVVFGFLNTHGKHQVASCSTMVPKADAEALIAQLSGL